MRPKRANNPRRDRHDRRRGGDHSNNAGWFLSGKIAHIVANSR